MRILIGGTLALLISTHAFAGTPVYGQGKTVEIALGKTAEVAWNLAKQRGTCISQSGMPRVEMCKKHDEAEGIWECSADVANHKGSCHPKGGNWFKENEAMINTMILAGKAAAGAP